MLTRPAARLGEGGPADVKVLQAGVGSRSRSSSGVPRSAGRPLVNKFIGLITHPLSMLVPVEQHPRRIGDILSDLLSR